MLKTVLKGFNLHREVSACLAVPGVYVCFVFKRVVLKQKKNGKLGFLLEQGKREIFAEAELIGRAPVFHMGMFWVDWKWHLCPERWVCFLKLLDAGTFLLSSVAPLHSSVSTQRILFSRHEKIKKKDPKHIFASEEMNGEVRFSTHLPQPHSLCRYVCPHHSSKLRALPPSSQALRAPPPFSGVFQAPGKLLFAVKG